MLGKNEIGKKIDKTGLYKNDVRKNQSGVLHLTQKVECFLESIARVEKLRRNVE